MKRLIITILTVLSHLLINAQQINSITVSYQSSNQIMISSVYIGDNSTIIDFKYTIQDGNERPHLVKIGLETFYIEINQKKYKLKETIGISNNRFNNHQYEPGQVLTFSAIFDPIPSNTIFFNLIEGIGGTWNFYGVSLNSNEICQINVDEGRINGYDISNQNAEYKEKVSFQIINKHLYMQNIHTSKKTIDWGRLEITQLIRKTDEKYQYDEYTCKWTPQSTYNDKSEAIPVVLIYIDKYQVAQINIATDAGVISFVGKAQGNINQLKQFIINKPRVSQKSHRRQLTKKRN